MAITTTTTRNALSPLFLLIVPILGLLLYFGTLNDVVINEGNQLTILNEQVTGSGPWSEVWTMPTPAHEPGRFAYRPVLAGLLRLEYLRWQASPSSYHSVSLILFLGILVTFILLGGRLMSHPGARVAAALTLALHPIFTQAVENVAAQGVLLALLASLAACYVLQLYRHYVLKLPLAALLVALLAFVAIGSHELGLLLPLWLAAVAVLTLRPAPPARPAAARARRRQGDEPQAEPVASRPSAARLLLAFGLPLVVLVGLYLFQRHRVLGALLPPPLAGLGSGLAVAPRILGACLGRLLWPVHPTYFYSVAESWTLTPVAPLAWAILAGLLAATAVACRRWKIMGLALIFLVTPLLALSHLLPLTFFISEQPLAFALPGLALVVGAVVWRLTAPLWSFPPERARDKALVGVLCVAWVAMGWQTFHRTGEWATPETLWQAEAARHPASAAPLVELMDTYVRRDKAELARNLARQARPLARPHELDRIIELEAGLAAVQKDDVRLKELLDEALNPKHRPSSPEHLVRMAILAHGREFRDEYVRLLRRQIEFYPKSFEAYYQLAQVELDAKNIPEAIRLGSLAVQHSRGRMLQAKAFERYGIILAQAGNYPVAQATLEQALQLDNTLYLPYIHLARLLWGKGDLESAKAVITACYANVGSRVSSYRDLMELYTGVLESQNRQREAVEWMTEQMDRFPADIPLQIFGARYLIEVGRYDRARQAFESIAPMPAAKSSLPDILVGMGLIALRGDRNSAAAEDFWRKALKVDPLNREARNLLDALDKAPSWRDQKNEPIPAASSRVGPQPPAAPFPVATPIVPPASGGGLSLGAGKPSPVSTSSTAPSPAIR